MTACHSLISATASWAIVAGFVGGYLLCAVLWVYAHRIVTRRDREAMRALVDANRLIEHLRDQVRRYELGGAL